jgi:hypothetical protein
MRWLLTTRTQPDRVEFERLLSERGVVIAPGTSPTPLDPDEQVYIVDGPANLEGLVRDLPQIHRVNPASRFDLFGVQG